MTFLGGEQGRGVLLKGRHIGKGVLLRGTVGQHKSSSGGFSPRAGDSGGLTEGGYMGAGHLPCMGVLF